MPLSSFVRIRILGLLVAHNARIRTLQANFRRRDPVELLLKALRNRQKRLERELSDWMLDNPTATSEDPCHEDLVRRLSKVHDKLLLIERKRGP